MAVRTIGVNVTGKQSIKDMEKRLDALKKSVLTIEDSVGKWGKAKKGSTPLSFRVEVTLDDTKLKAQLRGLKASLKDLDGYVKVGTGGSSSNNKDGGARRISNALYRDNLQDLQQATRDLQNNLQRASESVRKFTGNLLQFSIKTPAQGLFNAFNSVSRMVLNAGRSLETTLRTSITGVLSTAFRHIAYQVQNVFSSVVQETKAIGDSLATYRLQMQQLGLDDKQINSQLRDLTDYGKKTVYDAADLIKYAGDYRAYGREDAIEVVKALAGLAAQTVNPNESIDGISKQLSDMLARDKVAWQDVKFMKGWMNASGSKQLQDILDTVAQGKGHKNLIKAIEKNDITPDEFMKAIKDVGLSESFQKLVNSIVTPTQALDNLKENLSNLFIVPDYFDDGSVQEAPLAKLYSSTTEFIKGISAIVDSTRVKNGIRVVGDDLAYVIDSIKASGAIWNSMFGERFLKSLQTFYGEFKQGFGTLSRASHHVGNFTRELTKFNSQVGNSVGRFTKEFGNNLVDFLTALTNASRIGINSGFLDGINGILELYTNLANLASRSGAVATFSKQFSNFFKVVNSIVKDARTTTALRPLVESIDRFATVLLNSIKDFALNGNGIRNSASFVSTLFKTLGSMLTEIKLNTGSNGGKAFGNVVDALKIVIRGVKDVWVEILSSAINVAGSEKGKKFFEAVADLVVAVNKAVVNAFSSLGGGSVEKGLEKIIRLFTGLAEFFTVIVNAVGNNPHVALAMIALPKITKLFMDIKNFLALLNGINFVNAGAGLAMGKKALTGASIAGGSGVGSIVASGGMYAGIKGLFRSLRDSVHIFAIEATENGLMSAIKYVFPKVGSMLGNAGKFLKGGLGKGLSIAGIASMVVDLLVQNSGASDGIKRTSSTLSSALGWGATGATLGSMIAPGAGTAIGGILGALGGGALGFFGFNSKERELEQERQKIYQQGKERIQEIADEVKALIEYERDMYGVFFKEQKGTNGTLGGVYNAMSYIQQLADQRGASMEATLRELGYSVDQIPEGIEQMYVKIGDSLVSWQELREQTGLTDEELIGTLQKAFSSWDEAFFNLTDSAGNVITSVVSETQKSQEALDRHYKLFREALAEAGLGGIGLDTLSEGQIYNAYNDLQSVKGNVYATDEDQKRAYIEALSQGREDIRATLEAMQLSEIKALVDSTENAFAGFTGGDRKLQADLIEEIKKTANIGPEKAEELMGMSLEALQQELDAYLKGDEAVASGTLQNNEQRIKDLMANIEATKDKSINKIGEDIASDISYIQKHIEAYNSEGTTREHNRVGEASNRIREELEKLGISSTEVQTKVLDLMVNQNYTLEEAIRVVDEELLANTQVKQLKIEELRTNSTNFLNEVVAMLDDGKISIDDARAIVEGVDLTTIDKSQLSSSATKFLEENKNVVKKSSSFIDKLRSMLNFDFNGIDVTEITRAGTWLLDSMTNGATSVGSFLANLGAKVSNFVGQIQGKAPLVGPVQNNSRGKISPLAYRASGGPINWVPRGTDTVPAMLTPGEYVLRKKAVESLGTTFLNKLNTHGAQALSHTRSVVNNYYNTNNAKINQNIDNKSQYLNGMQGLDRLMRYV